MAVTVWPRAVDALVTALAASAGFQRAGATGAGTPVYDGVEILASAEVPDECVVIGWGDDVPVSDRVDPADLAPPGSADQAWHAMRVRAEQGEIMCAVIAHGGSVDPSDTRTRATATLDAMLGVLADDPTLGQLGWDVQVVDVQPRHGLSGERGDFFAWRVTVRYGAQLAPA